MERTERPTPSRLEELREQGRVPLSPLAVSAGGCASLLFSLYLLGDVARRALSGLMSAEYEHGLPPALLSDLLAVIIVPPVFYGLGGLLVGLIQTRFLIAPSLLSFRSERLSLRFGGNRFFSSLLRVGLGLGLGVSALWFLLPDGLRMFNTSEEDVRRMLRAGISWGLFPVMFLLLLGGLIAWLFERESFLRANRMTRQEARAQSREV